MDFRKRTPDENPPALPAGEEAYLVTCDNGREVHAACWTEIDQDARRAGRFGVRGVARAIHANGNPVLDFDAAMIIGEGSGAIAIGDLIVGGVVNTEKRDAVVRLALTNAIDTMLAELVLAEAGADGLL